MAFNKEYWMPSKEGEQPEIETVANDGPDLSDTEALKYFADKLKMASKIPFSRFDKDSPATYEMAAEGMQRDEIKFAKFVSRLRLRFSELFNKILERQLVLKGVISSEEWLEFKNAFKYDFAQDNYFAELKKTEVLRDRVSMLRDMNDYVGKYYSNEYIRKNVLYQTDDDIEQIDKQIQEEQTNSQYNPSMDSGENDGDGQEEQPVAQPPLNTKPENVKLPNSAGTPPGFAQ
jgi:hypothetical protein